MKRDIPEAKLKQLKLEFTKLKTLDEQYQFWEKELNLNYVFSNKLIFNEGYSEFKINLKSEDEIFNINMKNLEYLKSYKGREMSWDEVYDIDKLTKDYNTELKEVKDKESFKKIKLRDIDLLLQPQPPNFRGYLTQYIDEDFKNSFDSYMIYENKPDFKSELYEAHKLVNINNGFVLAQFYKFVESKKQTSEKDTTVKQQILILEYLGVLDEVRTKLDDTKKMGQFFSKLLNKSSKNIEDAIRYVQAPLKSNGIKTKPNLEFVFNLFDNAGLKEKSETIKNELNKING